MTGLVVSAVFLPLSLADLVFDPPLQQYAQHTVSLSDWGPPGVEG